MPVQPNVPWYMQVLPWLFLMAMVYFVLLKPQQDEQKRHKAMIDGLKKNDEVVTSAGIHGTIINVKETTFVIRVDDNVKLEIDKAAVARIKRKRE